MDFSKKIAAGIFVLFLASLVSAQDLGNITGTSQELELQLQCLNQNASQRQIWAFQVGPPGQNYGLGGAVQSNPINELYTAYCIQIDCVQNSFSTEPVLWGCNGKQAKYVNYDVTFKFPVCQPVYAQQVSLQQDDRCLLCPDAQSISAPVYSSCENGKAIYKQNINVFYGNNCVASQQIVTLKTNDSCYPDFVPAIILIAIIALGGFYFARK